MIAVLFCWHTQQRSDMGFITVMCGTSLRQRVQKVEYAAALSPDSSHDARYTIHTAYQDSTGNVLIRTRVAVYLLCGTGWEELEVISFVARYASRQKNGMHLCVIHQEPDHIPGLHKGQGIVWKPFVVPVLSGSQPHYQVMGFECEKSVSSWRAVIRCYYS